MKIGSNKYKNVFGLLKLWFLKKEKIHKVLFTPSDLICSMLKVMDHSQSFQKQKGYCGIFR